MFVFSRKMRAYLCRSFGNMLIYDTIYFIEFYKDKE